MATRKTGYPSDVSDEEWALCAPYLTLMRERRAPQNRQHSLRELFNGLRWFVRAGCPWRMMPNDLPLVDGGATADATLAARGVALKPWPKICAWCCAWSPGELMRPAR